jgi:hypothetical protein
MLNLSCHIAITHLLTKDIFKLSGSKVSAGREREKQKRKKERERSPNIMPSCGTRDNKRTAVMSYEMHENRGNSTYHMILSTGTRIGPLHSLELDLKRSSLNIKQEIQIQKPKKSDFDCLSRY